MLFLPRSFGSGVADCFRPFSKTSSFLEERLNSFAQTINILDVSHHLGSGSNDVPLVGSIYDSYSFLFGAQNAWMQWIWIEFHPRFPLTTKGGLFYVRRNARKRQSDVIPVSNGLRTQFQVPLLYTLLRCQYYVLFLTLTETLTPSSIVHTNGLPPSSGVDAGADHHIIALSSYFLCFYNF